MRFLFPSWAEPGCSPKGGHSTEVLPGFSPELVVFFVWLHVLSETLFQGDYQLRVILLFLHVTNVSVLAALGRYLEKCFSPSWVWETAALPSVKSFRIHC